MTFLSCISPGHCVWLLPSCILSFVLYTVLCMLMIEPFVHVTSPIPCLVSINSSLDDLIESVYYMLIPMQPISVLRIFSSFCINTQSNYICKIPCSKTKSHKLSLQKCKSPLALWPPRGVTSSEASLQSPASLFSLFTRLSSLSHLLFAKFQSRHSRAWQASTQLSLGSFRPRLH